MKLLLTAISGASEGRTFSLEPNQCATFGRTTAATHCFEDDGHMSSIHFEVENFGTHAEIRDRGSTNGTWLNNQKVLAEQLRDGDRLRAGKTTWSVELMRSGGAELPQPPQLSPDESVTYVPAVLPPAGYPTPPDTDRRPSAPARETPREAPAPAPKPLTPSLRKVDDQKRRPLNPFDSFDFGNTPAPEPERGPAAAAFGGAASSPQREVSTPFEESSFALPAETPVVSSSPAATSGFAFFARRTSADAADALAVVLDSLAKRWSIQVVVHFQKIRSAPPGNSQGEPLFKWLPEANAFELSPIRLAWNEVQADNATKSLLPRLCRADACVAFLGDSKLEVARQVDGMLEIGLEQFSEPGGFLPCFWPSSLTAMFDVHGIGGCKQLFGESILGAIYCSPWHRNYVLAAARGELASDLEDSGFAITDTLLLRD